MQEVFVFIFQILWEAFQILLSNTIANLVPYMKIFHRR